MAVDTLPLAGRRQALP